MDGKKPTIDVELEKLQRETFCYFLHEVNPANGLVIDKTAPDWPASVAATGLALAAYPTAVERSFMTRDAAIQRVLATLRFFWSSRQGPEPDATGHYGFYYLAVTQSCTRQGRLERPICDPTAHRQAPAFVRKLHRTTHYSVGKTKEATTTRE